MIGATVTNTPLMQMKSKVLARTRHYKTVFFGTLLLFLIYLNYDDMEGNLNQRDTLFQGQGRSLMKIDSDIILDAPSQEKHDTNKLNSLQKIDHDIIPNTPFQGQELKGRVILLAGPHKTGSTSLQTIANTLSNIGTVPWSYSDPWSTKSHEQDFIKLHHEKHFAALLFALRGELSHKLFVNPPVDKEEVKQLFRDDLVQKWNSGQNNLILGSEEVDSIIADQLDGAAILDEMLSILPEGAKDRTTAVVMYRSPRIKHLISVYKEIEANAPEYNNISFMDFLFHSQSHVHLEAVDSLALADFLVNKGMNVTIVDMEGLIKHNVDYYQLLLCDLMHECDDNMTPTFFNSLKPDRVSSIISRFTEKKNVRSNGIIDVPKSALDDIEKAIKHYDCRYKHLLGHKHVTIIHDNSLVEDLQKCIDDVKVGRMELSEDIKNIADPERSVLKNKKNDNMLFRRPWWL